MAVPEAILETSLSRLTSILFVGLVLFCPGMAALSLFSPSSYEKLEWARLWPLAFAIALPFFGFNWALLALWWMNTDKDDNPPREEVVEGSLLGSVVFTSIALYLPLIIRLIVGESFAIGMGIWAAVGVNALLQLRVAVTLAVKRWEGPLIISVNDRHRRRR